MNSEFLIECVGIPQVIGNGSIAQSHLSKGEKGDYFTINWGWALGCSLGILISANASGKQDYSVTLTQPFNLIKRIDIVRRSLEPGSDNGFSSCAGFSLEKIAHLLAGSIPGLSSRFCDGTWHLLW